LAYKNLFELSSEVVSCDPAWSKSGEGQLNKSVTGGPRSALRHAHRVIHKG